MPIRPGDDNAQSKPQKPSLQNQGWPMNNHRFNTAKPEQLVSSPVVTSRRRRVKRRSFPETLQVLRQFQVAIQSDVHDPSALGGKQEPDQIKYNAPITPPRKTKKYDQSTDYQSLTLSSYIFEFIRLIHAQTHTHTLL